MSVVLRVAYDGAAFHGFARQRPRPDGRPLRTIQGALEAALSELYRQPIEVRGASRTDAGVHARGQIVAFDPPFAIPPRGLVLGLAGKLPDDLIVTSAWEEVPADGGRVEPRQRNLGKHYRYVIRSATLRDPDTIGREWHLPRRPLDLDAMRDGAARLIGELDFAAFRAAACQAPTTIRRITAITITGEPVGLGIGGDPAVIEATPAGRVIIDVEGKSFLHNMVRIIVGTLVKVGTGRRPPSWVDELLTGRDRHLAGVTAPAHALTLVEVRWPNKQVF